MHRRIAVRIFGCLVSLMIGGPLVAFIAPSVQADITCYDFSSQAEAQTVYDALPGDPYGLDTGWPAPGVVGGGDQEASNGVACDAESKLPERESPGNEKYAISENAADNGLVKLPKGDIEKATINEVQYAEAIQTKENPSKFYSIMGIATPEYEVYSDYEGHDVPGQCGAAETTARLQELLAPGTTVWLQIDKAGFYTATMLDRQVWIRLDGRYRLVSEILVSEGLAVVATERPGTARPDAGTNPPPGAMYRDALRRAQQQAISEKRGIWGQCAR